MKTSDHGSIRLFEVDAEGPLFSGERDAVDIIGGVLGEPTDHDALVAVPVARLVPDFLKLGTGLAGAFIQKFVNYGLRLAFVGDIAAQIAASDALKAFVAESNRGATVWFAADMAELERRLSPHR